MGLCAGENLRVSRNDKALTISICCVTMFSVDPAWCVVFFFFFFGGGLTL